MEEQRKGLLDSLNDADFINQLFPAYKQLQENFEAVLQANAETADRKQAFDEWEYEGKVIEGEYKIISSNLN